MVRIRFPPAESPLRTDFSRGRVAGIWRLMGTCVGKILKGVKPADLPQLDEPEQVARLILAMPGPASTPT